MWSANTSSSTSRRTGVHSEPRINDSFSYQHFSSPLLSSALLLLSSLLLSFSSHSSPLLLLCSLLLCSPLLLLSFASHLLSSLLSPLLSSPLSSLLLFPLPISTCTLDRSHVLVAKFAFRVASGGGSTALAAREFSDSPAHIFGCVFSCFSLLMAGTGCCTRATTRGCSTNTFGTTATTAPGRSVCLLHFLFRALSAASVFAWPCPLVLPSHLCHSTGDDVDGDDVDDSDVRCFFNQAAFPFPRR